MNYKLLILLALMGCWSVASQAIETEPGSTAGTETSSTASSESGSTVEIEASDATTTESANTAGTGATSATTTESASTAGNEASKTEPENTAGTEAPSTTTKAPAGEDSTKRPRFPPHHPHGPRPNGVPRVPIISDIIDAIQTGFQSLIPRPVNRGRPGPHRFRRGVSFQGGFNISGITDFLNSLPGLPGLPGIPDMSNFELPNVDEIVPEIPESSDSSDVEIPEVSDLPRLPPIPGLQAAMTRAREMIAKEINAGEDLVSGIADAIQTGLSSSNPTEAIRKLVSTILRAYWNCAQNCPLLIVGGFVMREGLYLASDVLRIIADVSAQIQGVE